MLYDNYFKRKNKNTISFNDFYKIWSNRLFEFEISIFEWTGLPFPQRELESILVCNGIAGIDIANKYRVYDASLYNPGYNRGSYQNAVLTNNKSSITFDINNIIVIRNNEIGDSSIGRIRIYSSLLAHAFLSIQAALINYRKNGTIIAPNDAAAESVSRWYNDLADGKLAAIISPTDANSLIGNAQLEMHDITGQSASLTDCITAARNILRLYYAEIGINMADDKKERQIVPEVESNDDMLRYNIDSMFKCRKQAAKDISDTFGIKCDVKINIRRGVTDDDR